MTVTYVDYTYYVGTYRGTVIASDDFPQLALRASAILDQITFQRAAPIVAEATDADTIDRIKMATCTIAEEYQRVSTGSNQQDYIQQETVGAHSVTYFAGAGMNVAQIESYSDIARVYLASTGLMFRGFTIDES
jgi:hypothetical protein